MVPMIGGKVEERQQRPTILDQAFDGLVVFGRVFLGEGRHRRFRRGPVRRQPDLPQILVRVGLHRLGKLVEHVQCLVQPAPLMTRRRERLVEGLPEPSAPSPMAACGATAKPRAFKATTSSFQLCALSHMPV